MYVFCYFLYYLCKNIITEYEPCSPTSFFWLFRKPHLSGGGAVYSRQSDFAAAVSPYSAGGATWLPIYFFTLVAAYKFGWRVGLITAVASPLLNSVLFGMPPAAALPAILLKSVLLAVISGAVASRKAGASLPALVAVVLAYQVTGCLGEWIMKADFVAACQDFRIGIPGMLLQIIGGWALINYMPDRH